MSDFAELLDLSLPDPSNAGEVAIAIALSFFLGLVVAQIYRMTHRGATVSFSLVNTLVLLSMIMTLVIMVIGSNIARAFGLAGAMSIIRFRTAVRDARDTAFVFYAVAAGMAAGTGHYMLALLGTLMVGGFICLLHFTRHGAIAANEFLVSFEMGVTGTETERTIFEPVFGSHLTSWSLVNVRSARMGEQTRLSYRVLLKKRENAALLVEELAALEGLARVSLSFGDEGRS